MKNIHVLPTDKPSRLYLTTHEYIFEKGYALSTDECQNKNIYITSDEEIKQGDCVYSTSQDYNIQKVSKELVKVYQEVEHYKKIILTTDQDLIKDGVQAIDDEFLEWFVENPSCEEVKVVEQLKYFNLDELRERSIKGLPHIYSEKIGYKIIIPKEEIKQENDYTALLKQVGTKQEETLEEAVNREFPFDYSYKEREAMSTGAKWQQQQDKKKFSADEVRDILKVIYKNRQQERSYSEEEVLNLLTHFAVEIQRQNKKGQYPIQIKGWFERNKETFKKK